MLVKGKSPTIARQADNAYTTPMPFYEGTQLPLWSAIAASALRSNGEASGGRLPTSDNSKSAPGSSLARPEASTGREKDSSPYWSDFTADISSRLWLPTGTASSDSAVNSSSGWSSKTAVNSWFSTSRMAAPNQNATRIYSPSSILSAAGCTDSEGTDQQARKLKVYPTSDQKLMLRTWLDASRWVYNLTVEILQHGVPADWKYLASMVVPELKLLHPEWKAVPYQVKRTAVRDACRAMSNVKIFNMKLAEDKARGERLGEEYAELHFRSRKNPKQSCYIPDDAVTKHGVYHKILGPMRMAEAIPEHPKESRLVKERGLYWLAVPHPAQCDIETPCGDGVIALDPGVRTFLTFFSETECGKIGYKAFGRIQRLCHWLDELIGRTDTEPDYHRRRRMRRAQARMRQRIVNLVDELHWQTARWLTSNYKVILLPTFETQDMTRRAGRKIRSKTARMMLTPPPLRVQAAPDLEGMATGSLGAGGQRGLHQQDL